LILARTSSLFMFPACLFRESRLVSYRQGAGGFSQFGLIVSGALHHCEKLKITKACCPDKLPQCMVRRLTAREKCLEEESLR